MRSRRAARLNAPPVRYHAITRYSGTAGDPEDEGYALCSDCGTDDCAQYQRIQARRARHLTNPSAQAHGPAGWGIDRHWPF
ncbi:MULTISPECIES: hypothetical protein [Streptomyces]|uniref:hypothetical protein n=1 Tax=Streptomyces TaxID=1883 RepID=UPI002F91381E